MANCVVSDSEPVGQVRAQLLDACVRMAQFQLSGAVRGGCWPEILTVLTSARYATFREEIIGSGFSEVCGKPAGSAISSLIEVLLSDSIAEIPPVPRIDMRIRLLEAQRANRLGACLVGGEMAAAALIMRRPCTEAEYFIATAAGREAVLVDTGASLDYLHLYL